MTSKIVPSFKSFTSTPTVPTYDVYDMGTILFRDVSLSWIQEFMKNEAYGNYPDLYPTEFLAVSHGDMSKCWDGEVAVAYVNSVDYTTGNTFPMPRCVSCLAGPDATII